MLQYLSLSYFVCLSSSRRSHRLSIVGVSGNVERPDVVWAMGWLVAKRRSHNLHIHLHGNQLVYLLLSLILPSFFFNSGSKQTLKALLKGECFCLCMCMLDNGALLHRSIIFRVHLLKFTFYHHVYEEIMHVLIYLKVRFPIIQPY